MVTQSCYGLAILPPPTSTKWREGCAGHFKICISPQFWTSDEHEVKRGLRRPLFAFHHSFGRPMSTKRRKGPERTQADSHFTTVLDVRRARSDERVASAWRDKFAFHHSFGRPTTTKWREGWEGHVQNSLSPQFWASDEHEVTRGLFPAGVNQTHPA